jgi:hypothetical protein
MDPRTPNNALEQPAVTSRPWHGRQEVDSKGLARQERSAPPLLTAGVRPLSSRPCGHRLSVIFVLSVSLVVAGCASSVRLYPRHSDAPRNLHDTLVSIKSGTNLVVRMHDGTRTQGHFTGITAFPDSALLLRGAERSSNSDAVPIAGIAYLGEHRGWTRPTPIVITGIFLSFIALAFIGGHSESPFSN